MMHLHADSFARIRKVSQNNAMYEKANCSSYVGIRDSDLNRYLVACKSCDWNIQYLVRSADLDISGSTAKCPVCRMKSIECSPIPLRQGDYSRILTSGTLPSTLVRNRNKVIDKVAQSYELLSHYTGIIIAKGLLDMDRTG